MSGDNMAVSMVFLDEGEQGGGIAHPTRQLAAALQRDVTVTETPILKEESRNPWYWYALGQKAAEDADIVHIHFEYGSFGRLGAIGSLNGLMGVFFPVFAAGADAPMVASLHNFQRAPERGPVGGIRQKLRDHLENPNAFVDYSLLAHVDAFIALAKFQERALRNAGVASDQVEYIPLAPETEPDFRDPATSKSELGVAGKKVVTGFGWVRRSKGYDRIIKVLDDLPDDTVFMVAGGTQNERQEAYLEELVSMAHSKGLEDRVVFTGYVDQEDHPTILSASDVAVFPYRDNRASDAVAKALSYHVPVVAADNEEFSHFESEWGCVLCASTTEAFARELNRVLTDEDLREQLVDRASKFQSRLNWDTIADEVLNIYERMS